MTVALFIGLLTLFAIIQGSIISAKQKDISDVLTRKKRDLSFQIEEMVTALIKEFKYLINYRLY